MRIHNALCWLGLHDWKYGKQIFNAIEIATRQFKRKVEAKTRECKSCGKKQYFTKRPSNVGVSDNEWKTIEK